MSWPRYSKFQFLIGKVKTLLDKGVTKKMKLFQFLIGKVKTRKKKSGTGRKSRLKRKVKLRIKLIDKLKEEENLGWRLIARYLEKYADLKISHAQLRRLYLQIKEEEENK